MGLGEAAGVGTALTAKLETAGAGVAATEAVTAGGATLIADRGAGAGRSAGADIYVSASGVTVFHFAIPNCVNPPSDSTISAIDFVHMRNDLVFLIVVSPEREILRQMRGSL